MVQKYTAIECAVLSNNKTACSRPADGSWSKVVGKSRRSRGSVRLYSTEEEAADLPARLPARRRRRLYFSQKQDDIV